MPMQSWISAAGRLPRTTWQWLGWRIIMVPDELRTDQLEITLNELKVDAEEVPGLGGWRTSDDTAVARVPFPGRN